MHTLHLSEGGRRKPQLTLNCKLHARFDNRLDLLNIRRTKFVPVFICHLVCVLKLLHYINFIFSVRWPLYVQDNVVTQPCPSHGCQTSLRMRTLLIRNVPGNTRTDPRSIMFVSHEAWGVKCLLVTAGHNLLDMLWLGNELTSLNSKLGICTFCRSLYFKNSQLNTLS